MKKIILFVLLLVPAVAFAQKRDEAIIKDGFRIIPIECGRLITPFYLDGRPMKIGFVRNSSTYTILIEPTFDDVDNDRYVLVAVCKDRKWGVVDCALRAPSSNQPIIPCIYDYVKVIDNNTVEVVRNGVRQRITIE